MKSIKFLFALILVGVMTGFSEGQEKATIDFLNSLNEKLLGELMHSFNDDSRKNWHFLPSRSWPRVGLALGKLNLDQKELFFRMLENYLGEVGFDKTQSIIELEGILGEIENNVEHRDQGAYYIAIYGSPKKDKLWAWSFEGHHISLNFTISEGKISIAPRFFGANPAQVMSGPNKGLRTLQKEEDLAYILINKLSDPQKGKAIFHDKTFGDITTARMPEVIPSDPVGIKVEALNKKQKEILKELIDEYLRTLPKDLAVARSEKIRKEEFNNIHFGWAGSLIKGEPHYYRVQGKTFLIEFDNSQNNANHIHLVWRDFDGDFGRDLIREHYNTSHHQ